MKEKSISFIFAACLMYFSHVSLAAPYNCQRELRNLVVPALASSPMPKSKMQVELQEMSDDNGNPSTTLYGVQISVPADSPDNANGKVAIGWVNLDIGKMKAFDVSRDEGHPQELHLNKKRYSDFVKNCINQGS
ncbi:hypothetical protein [Burkholderia sp. D-99]|uniref:hypothetical protein n=1 Tax=Burkholderia sp. D-99 TaxID=2717316 RepID=UPI0014205B5F|nr:hypothetical protein [Burkholderia sp. D-99]NHV26448.1 hypothetical protein [Burkholderia sp. D-99]